MWLRLLWQSLSWRSRAKLDLGEVGIRTFRVWPTDLDIYMHMNNGIFLTLLDIGRYDQAMRSDLWPKWKARKWYPVVVASNITFRKSLTPWQLFDLETKVVGWDDEAFYFEQRFVLKGEIFARAIVRVRFLQNPRGIVSPAQVLEAIDWQGEQPVLPKWVADWAKSSLLPRVKEPAPSLWQ